MIQEYGVVSFPKSGRTWIRLFLEYYRRFAGMRSGTIVIFRHDNEFGFRKRLLLIRHPCDVMVSYWIRQRISRRISMTFMDFVNSERFGLPCFNRWHSIWSRRKKNQLVVRYEDLFIARTWVDILGFFDIPMVEDAFGEAINKTQFDTIRSNLSEIAKFPSAWRYLAAEDGNYGLVVPNNPESHKFRRGIVGGYVDYLSEEDIDYVLGNFTLGESLELYKQQYLLDSKR